MMKELINYKLKLLSKTEKSLIKLKNFKNKTKKSLKKSKPKMDHMKIFQQILMNKLKKLNN
jgi:hypothetical protein